MQKCTTFLCKNLRISKNVTTFAAKVENQSIDIMKKIICSALMSFLLIGCCSTSVQSPDSHLGLSFRLSEEGVPQYMVTRDDSVLIEWSALGLSAGRTDLTRDFLIKRTRKRAHKEKWETVWGEERFITDNHREMEVQLNHPSGIQMGIIFRVYNDGIAFRYLIKGQRDNGQSTKLTITDEATEYRFAQSAEIWSIPWRTEYYEGIWTKRS